MAPGAPPVVLASASAARAALLQAAGLRFEARSARIDEDAVKQAARTEGAPPEAAALLLAELKAARVRAPGALVIGADQLLVCEERWFDKPRDLAEAREHLLALRGRTHMLVTAAVCLRDGAPVWRQVATPRLRMRPFSEAFLDAYLAVEGDAMLASVGGYRLEGPGLQLFEAVEGEHAAVLGLPLLALLRFLREHGVLVA